MEEKSLQEEERRGGRNLLSLRKVNKIRKNSDFKEIFRSGKRKTGKNLTIIFLEKKGFKFGITFKKGVKSAVKRNRTKRRLTEIIRMRKELMKKDIHIVTHLSKTAIDLSFDELSGEFTHLLKDANIIE